MKKHPATLLTTLALTTQLCLPSGAVPNQPLPAPPVQPRVDPRTLAPDVLRTLQGKPYVGQWSPQSNGQVGGQIVFTGRDLVPGYFVARIGTTQLQVMPGGTAAQIAAQLPSLPMTGPLVVSYGTANTEVTLSQAFTVIPAPVVRQVTPNLWTPGTVVTITGERLNELGPEKVVIYSNSSDSVGLGIHLLKIASASARGKLISAAAQGAASIELRVPTGLQRPNTHPEPGGASLTDPTTHVSIQQFLCNAAGTQATFTVGHRYKKSVDFQSDGRGGGAFVVRLEELPESSVLQGNAWFQRSPRRLNNRDVYDRSASLSDDSFFNVPTESSVTFNETSRPAVNQLNPAETWGGAPVPFMILKPQESNNLIYVRGRNLRGARATLAGQAIGTSLGETDGWILVPISAHSGQLEVVKEQRSLYASALGVTPAPQLEPGVLTDRKVLLNLDAPTELPGWFLKPQGISGLQYELTIGSESPTDTRIGDYMQYRIVSHTASKIVVQVSRTATFPAGYINNNPYFGTAQGVQSTMSIWGVANGERKRLLTLPFQIRRP